MDLQLDSCVVVWFWNVGDSSYGRNHSYTEPFQIRTPKCLGLECLVHLGSEIQTSLNFKWSKQVCFANSPISKKSGF